jgi:GDPmannose 4,6-dehydratase
MKTAFITGVTGQDGAYLSQFLLDKDYRVYGLVMPQDDCENLDYLGIKGVSSIKGDVRSERSLVKAVRTAQPDEVYNLAGFTSPRLSWDHPQLVFDINLGGTLHLLEAVRKYAPHARVFQASTSEMFGSSHNKGLQTEETPMHPKNPYADSKLAAYHLTQNYRDRYGLFICNGICFSHESPLRSDVFVTRKITKAVARIGCGLDRTLKLGNLDSRRDWGFAGDYVTAMWKMLQMPKPDNYILSTGRTHTLRDFVVEAFRCVGIDNWQRFVVIDGSLKDPTTVRVLKGHNAKAKKVLGWEPTVGFKELVQMMVDADIGRLQAR